MACPRVCPKFKTPKPQNPKTPLDFIIIGIISKMESHIDRIFEGVTDLDQELAESAKNKSKLWILNLL